jgi:hypothetical protein
LCAVFLGATIVIVLRQDNETLTRLERPLVGRWGYAITDPAFQFYTEAGRPIRDALDVIEFGDNHVCRTMVVSAADPGQFWVRSEGRWRVVDGRLRLEDFPRSAMRRALRDARFKVADTLWAKAGVIVPRGPDRIGSFDLYFRFPEEGALELSRTSGKPLTLMTREQGAYVTRRLPVARLRRGECPRARSPRGATTPTGAALWPCGRP